MMKLDKNQPNHRIYANNFPVVETVREPLTSLTDFDLGQVSHVQKVHTLFKLIRFEI